MKTFIIHMKPMLFSFLLVIIVASVQAQQDYKALLSSFHHHSENNFKDIIGKQTDTTSVFYPSKLQVDAGVVKIGKYPNSVTLNWIIPLAQSQKIQAAARDFMKVTFGDNKLYKTVSDGTEAEGDVMTNVYALGSPKPLLVFQTMYYRNSEEPEKSNFTIVIYGK